MKLSSDIYLLGCFFLIEGCTPLPEISEELSLWQTRQLLLNELHDWEFNGRIALHYEDQGWFANLHWQQHGQNYQIQIIGPAGQGVAQFQGNPNQVTLIQRDKTISQAANPEELLATHFGWKIPVTGIQYWIRGLPTPANPEKIQWDTLGRLLELNQDGWNIQFNNYTAVGKLELPQRLILTNRTIQAQIIIDQWRLF